jgi:hypothetical protein
MTETEQPSASAAAVCRHRNIATNMIFAGTSSSECEQVQAKPASVRVANEQQDDKAAGDDLVFVR